MKLQMLVPQYTEDDSVIKPLLDSIALQQNVDFNEIGVIIVNDGSDVLLKDIFNRGYPYDLQYFTKPHRGVSATRNCALDAAVADYVMFCDADDMFYSMIGLWSIFNDIECTKFDVLIPSFVEETKFEDGRHVFINHVMDSTFVHGKVFRREYLISKKIRFNPELTIHEDSYFNVLAQQLTKKVAYSEMSSYLWRWRDESVCRHDPKYMLKTYNNLIDSNDALVDEFVKRRRNDKAMWFCGIQVWDAYYTMNKPDWVNQENQIYRDMTERRFAKYYNKHKKRWNRISLTDKMAISREIRNRSILDGMLIESVTIDDWLKQIESK